MNLIKKFIYVFCVTLLTPFMSFGANVLNLQCREPMSPERCYQQTLYALNSLGCDVDPEYSECFQIEIQDSQSSEIILTPFSQCQMISPNCQQPSFGNYFVDHCRIGKKVAISKQKGVHNDHQYGGLIKVNSRNLCIQ